MTTEPLTMEDIEACCREYEIEHDDSVDEIGGWKRGEFIRITEDDDHHGVYEGEEGVIIAFTKVGAAQYGNERHALYVKIEGCDPTEADPYKIESI